MTRFLTTYIPRSPRKRCFRGLLGVWAGAFVLWPFRQPVAWLGGGRYDNTRANDYRDISVLKHLTVARGPGIVKSIMPRNIAIDPKNKVSRRSTVLQHSPEKFRHSEKTSRRRPMRIGRLFRPQATRLHKRIEKSYQID